MCVEKRGEVKMSIVEVRGLCKAFGDNQVLKNLDFQIEKGEVVTLIGPSGGGKTTLLRSLNWLNVLILTESTRSYSQLLHWDLMQRHICQRLSAVH